MSELTAERRLRKLRIGYLGALMRQEIAYFDSTDAAILAVKLFTNSEDYRSGIGQCVGILSMFVAIALGSIGYAFYIAWDIALVATASFPLIVGFGIWSTKVEVEYRRKTSFAFEGAGSAAREVLNSVRTVKAYCLEKSMAYKFGSLNDSVFGFGVKGSQLIGFGRGAQLALLFASFGWNLHYAVKTSMEERDPVRCFEPDSRCRGAGEAIMAFTMVMYAAYFLSKIERVWSERNKALSALNEIAKVYERKPEMVAWNEENGIVVNPGNFNGRIEFKDVNFSYVRRSEAPVFKKLNFTIEAGETVAFVGGSGCGKTTIIQLIERFYEPSSGQILVDGISIEQYNLGWLRSQMSIVSQEPRLFNETIKENIARGLDSREISNDKIINAAKQANAHSFISQFPRGYDTWVGEGGSQLSGGQKQRIAIARAVLRDSKVMILDEPTSALDNESEKIVQETLSRVIAEGGKRTTIIVAHRLSTVRNADRIFVLGPNPAGGGDQFQQGSEVLECGNHEELLRIPNGLYHSLVTTATGGLVSRLAEKFEDEIPKARRSLVSLQSKFSTNAGDPGYPPFQSRIWSYRPGIYRRTVQPVHRDRLVIGVLAAICHGLVWPLFVVLLAQFIRRMVDDPLNATKMTLHFIKWFLGLASLALICVWTQIYIMEWSGQTLIRDIRTRLFGSMLRQNIPFFDDPVNSSGALLNILISDTGLLKVWGGEILALYIQCGTAVVAAMIISMIASWKLGLLSSCAIIILAPLNILHSKFSSGKKRTSSALGVQELLNEVVTNIRIVNAYNLQPSMSLKFSKIVDQEYSEGKKYALYIGIAWGVSQSLFLLVICSVFHYGVHLESKEYVPFEKMIQATLSLLFAATTVSEAFSGTPSWKRARLAGSRIYHIIDNVPVVDEFSGGKTLSEIHDLRFENVEFHYPQRPDIPVYKNVSYQIKRGQTVALVGMSGCGKTTSVQLLERFYDAVSGSIKINGSDIREFNIPSLRYAMGLVSQEPLLFTGTVDENIAMGRIYDANIQDVIEASKMSNAYDFIMALPDKFNTKIDQNELSSGQKQRLAIARAIIRKPKLLILDEATAALDNKSEKIVQDALNQLTGTYMTLVIAHRLSTIRQADVIVILNNRDSQGSRVEEIGTHQELMNIPDGIYRGLINIARAPY